MASLETRLKDLATRVATECKSIRTLTNGNAGSNVALLTTAKGNLVEALNELHGMIQNVASEAGARIDDTKTTGATNTYSINKIRALLLETAQDVQDRILGGAGEAFDTLKELQDLFEGNASTLSGFLDALAKRVRFDVANQGLTATEQGNARTNISVYSKAEIGNPDTDFAAAFVAGLA